MGNENINKDMKNLQNLLLNIVDENNKMKGKIEEMNLNILKLNEKNLKLNEKYIKQREDIEKLKENDEFLRDEYQNIKEILSNIQYRDLSKNFLKCFGEFLTDEDWTEIGKNKKKRGEIIADRIQKSYPNVDKKKMLMVRKLIENSSDLILNGNDLAHSLTLDKYEIENEIQSYKEKKNLKKLNSPVAFCFLLNLGISDNELDEAYSFLINFFNRGLPTEGSDLLDSYFK